MKSETKIVGQFALRIFAVRREIPSKTAKIAKPQMQSFAKKRFRLPN
jgi:hypothetical protein